MGQIYFKYMVLLTIEYHEETKEYWCSKANAKFTEPRIKRMWCGKPNVIGVWRVYKDTSCEEVRL